jgi:hypothetical protein
MMVTIALTTLHTTSYCHKTFEYNFHTHTGKITNQNIVSNTLLIGGFKNTSMKLAL